MIPFKWPTDDLWAWTLGTLALYAIAAVWAWRNTPPKD